MISGARGRFWRGYADGRRRLARDGSARKVRLLQRGLRRSDTAGWTEQLAQRHQAYRHENAPARGTVAIVCVSSRPHLLDDVISRVAIQTHADREFILVTNAAGYDEVDVEAAVRRLDDLALRWRVIRRPEQQELGACLNDAMDTTDARFVAKFDDDDHYGAQYLADALRAHGYAGAGVVGKHTYYAHLVAEDRTVLRFPAHEFRYSSTLAGGTLVIDRERTADLRFPDISLGEDRAFLEACHRRGISTFSADRFNFVQSRWIGNTWSVSTEAFLRDTLPVSSGLPLDTVHS